VPLPTPNISMDDIQIKALPVRSSRAANSDLDTPVTISSGGKHEKGLGFLSPVKVLHGEGGNDFSMAQSKSPGSVCKFSSLANCARSLLCSRTLDPFSKRLRTLHPFSKRRLCCPYAR
jgi:hypothetical protein